MRNAFIAGLLIAAATRSDAAEPSRFHLFGAAGVQLGDTAEHLAGGLGYSPKPYVSLGAELAYSYLPLAPQVRGGANRAYYGLLTLTAVAWPSGRASPFLVIGFGRGRYNPSGDRNETESGNAAALGVGFRVRLRPRVGLLAETRLEGIGGITASDGLHLELPLRIGIRVGL
jgi:hypothetical protein